MFNQLILYLCMLVIGGLIGHFELAHPKLNALLGKLQLLTLICLLFVMGIRVGADDQVIRAFDVIGLKALFIAVSSIFFSVLFVWMVGRLFRSDREEG